MVLDLVAVLGMGLAAGSVLGYWAAKPRVNRLEKELATVLRLEKANWLARDSRLAMAHSLENLKAQDLGKDWEQKKKSDWDSAQPLELELELESQTDLDLLSDLAKESARQEQEKRNWKVQG